jgi:hypothetical protein
MRAILVNDTALRNFHFGCYLVCQAIREQLAKRGIDLVASFSNQVRVEDLTEIKDRFDFIIVNGEGSIHHGRHRVLVELAARFPSFLINCTLQETSPDGLDLFKYIAVRESMSADFLQRCNVNYETVPDVIFVSSALTRYEGQKVTVRDLGISDSVTGCPGLITRLLYRKNFFTVKGQVVDDYVRFMVQSKRLCLGRFHAVCLAAKFGIPFSSWDSNTWKIEGIMRDMGVSKYHFKTFAEAYENVPTESDASVIKYAQDAPVRVENMFDTILDLVE